MANSPKNQEFGSQGGDIVLDAFYRTFDGGALVDTDTLPTIVIKDPNGVVVETGVAVKTSTGVYTYNYSIPLTAVVSDTWSITWSASINTITVPDSSEFFRVVLAGSVSFGDSIAITDFWLGQVKKVLAFPNIANIVLSDDDIKIYAVHQALHEYFTKFPKRRSESYAITGELVLPFPDLSSEGGDVFGCMDARIVGKTGQNTGSSSFQDITRFNRTSTNKGFGVGSYGTTYDFNGMTASYLAQQQVLDTFSNESTSKAIVNDEDRQVEFYSSVTATAIVTWGIATTDFSDVKRVYEYDVIKLAQSYLLDHLAQTSGIYEDPTVDQSIDTDFLKTKADDLRTEVMEKWAEIPDVVILRGS